MVAAHDSKSCLVRGAGSSPASGTSKNKGRIWEGEIVSRRPTKSLRLVPALTQIYKKIKGIRGYRAMQWISYTRHNHNMEKYSEGVAQKEAEMLREKVESGKASDYADAEKQLHNMERDRYFGVCDVISPEQARAMADELRLNRKNPDRKIMIGVMTHPIVLDPDLPVPKKVREEVSKEFPTTEEIAGGFTDDPDVLNTIHYADLYGPNGPWKAEESPDILKNLELCVQYGGENLHAIQLDVTWPDSNELKKFKEKYPNIVIVLQIGKFAINAVNSEPEEVVNRLREYEESIDFALLDMSMGMGKDMEAGGLLPLLRLIHTELPYLGLAVAGGLGPNSMDLLEPIAKEFPGIAIDAQGRLKPADAPRDSSGHIISTLPADLEMSKEYIQKSCTMLDNFNAA